MSNKQIVIDFYNQINAGNYDAYEKYCSEDFEDIASHGYAKGRDAVKAATIGMHSCFTNIKFTLDDVLEEADRVAIRGSLSATQTAPMMGMPNHNKSFQITFCGIYHIQNGKLVKRYINGDDALMARQLGWF